MQPDITGNPEPRQRRRLGPKRIAIIVVIAVAQLVVTAGLVAIALLLHPWSPWSVTNDADRGPY